MTSFDLRVLAVLAALVSLPACGRAERTTSATTASAPSAGADGLDPVSRAVSRATEILTAGAVAEDAVPLVVVLADEPSFVGHFAQLSAPARLVSLASDAERGADLGREAEVLGRVVERLAAARPTRGKPLLLGSGQGGTLALALAARNPRGLGAVVVVGADLPRNALPAGPPPDVGTPPLRVYIHHGSRDEIVPVVRGGAASDELAIRGLAAVLHLDPRAGHELTPHLVAEMKARLAEEIRDIR